MNLNLHGGLWGSEVFVTVAVVVDSCWLLVRASCSYAARGRILVGWVLDLFESDTLMCCKSIDPCHVHLAVRSAETSEGLATIRRFSLRLMVTRTVNRAERLPFILDPLHQTPSCQRVLVCPHCHLSVVFCRFFTNIEVSCSFVRFRLRINEFPTIQMAHLVTSFPAHEGP